MRTILIVDGDLGLVLWLGRMLVDAGHDAVPAQNIAEADRLMRELDLRVDLLVINPSLQGAADLLERLNR